MDTVSTSCILFILFIIYYHIPVTLYLEIEQTSLKQVSTNSQTLLQYGERLAKQSALEGTQQRTQRSICTCRVQSALHSKIKQPTAMMNEAVTRARATKYNTGVGTESYIGLNMLCTVQGGNSPDQTTSVVLLLVLANGKL